MSYLQVALGFIVVANEEMCRPIRTLTQVCKYSSLMLTSKLFFSLVASILPPMFSRASEEPVDSTRVQLPKF